MTEIGYKEIVNRIVNRTINPPTDLTISELQSWT